MPNYQSKIGERKAKKQREIDRDITLNDYIDKLNNAEITNYETFEVDMTKLGKNTEVKNLLKGNFDDHPKKRIGRATRGHEPTMIILDYSQTFAISHLKFKVELKTILASTVYSILSDSVSF